MTDEDRQAVAFLGGVAVGAGVVVVLAAAAVVSLAGRLIGALTR